MFGKGGSSRALGVREGRPFVAGRCLLESSARTPWEGTPALLILPLIDLLILSGTGMLVIGFILKAIAITTVYRPHILGFTSTDFVVLCGVCWVFALTLVARSWVRLNEPRILAARREMTQARARQQAHEQEGEYEAELPVERSEAG